ncbi:MAG: murein biosynthesis integral membrane protein MurJ [Candidatus Dependentiae bacterium]|nr:murein biosynthesis integral membrane protein MurJ [Candidatus Dependentiae bacterium]
MSRSIIKKAAGIGVSTLISRFFAYIREMLLIQFLGIGAISDAFFIALRVPNSLRKVFAEGALSSVLVPALINADRKNGRAGMNKLLTLSFVMIQLLISLIIIVICWQADALVLFAAPQSQPEVLRASAQYLKILAPFILFLSSSAILASALQAMHHFFLPGIAPAFLNCLYVGFLSLCLYFSWSVATFCWTMIFASIINLAVHFVVCIAYHFKAASPDKKTWHDFGLVMLQLFPCLLSVGIGEINFWIDSRFASGLQVGTLSLLRYAYQFVNIPLGVIATSLSIVLLPYFSKIGHSKQELGVYLAEAIKFVIWMMLPITIVMIFSSREIFETMFFSNKFTMDNVIQAQWNMNAYLIGLTFFALEKILLNAFYVLQSTAIATCVAIITIGMNYFLNSILMTMYGGAGLALATSITAAIRACMFIIILAYYFNINFHIKELWRLLRNYITQLFVLGSLFLGSAMLIFQWIESLLFSWSVNFGFIHFVFDAHFFLHSFGYWLWFGPLVGVFFVMIYGTRKFFGVSFSYLD